MVEIRSLSGIKFDPELVGILFEILPQIRQVRALVRVVRGSYYSSCVI
ncbi:MAG: hypothetical protein LBB98_12470 [Treponema sp.]|nr:hypothetical protein [Treponema sp.]